MDVPGDIVFLSEAAFFVNWYQDTNGAWRITNRKGEQVKDAWSKANGMWTFTKTDGNKVKNEWLLITVAGGNASYFYFDSNGNMVISWQQVGGKWMYLNNESGSFLGACLRGPGRTPDGYEIDAAGAWTGR